MLTLSDQWFADVLKSIAPAQKPPPPKFERYQELKEKCLALEKTNPLGMSIIFMIDYSRMQYDYISDLFCDFTGADRKKMYSETIEYGLSFIHPAYLEKLSKEVFGDMFQFIKSLDVTNEERLQMRASYNFKIRNKNGQYYSFVQRVIALEFNEEGHPLVDIGILTLDNSFTDDRGILLYMDKLDNSNIYQNLYRKHFPIEDTSPSNTLTTREMEIVLLIKNGLSSREIAERLYLSEHTVKNHKRNIFEKTGVNKVTELLEWLQKPK